MQDIPDTGPGLSGFTAYGVWHLYQLFPFPGTADWLLLFVLVVALAQLCLGSYAARWAAAGSNAEDLGVFVSLWSVAAMFAVVWFFHTPAGRTFLANRPCLWADDVADVNRGVFWACFLTLAAGYFGIFALVGKATGRTSSAWTFGLVPMAGFWAHATYWYWSAASSVLMVLFCATTTVTIIVAQRRATS